MPESAKIAAAFVAAQAELANPPKDRTANTGTYSYKYADLASVIDHVRPILSKHGLGVTQDVLMEDGRLLVRTRLVHSSGEFMDYGPLAGSVGSSWQQTGGGITYARRYALLAALGIAADEDDDGATAPPPASRRLRPVEAKPIADADMVQAWASRIGDATDFVALKAVGDEIAAHDVQPDTRKALLDAWRKRKAEVDA